MLPSVGRVCVHVLTCVHTSAHTNPNGQCACLPLQMATLQTMVAQSTLVELEVCGWLYLAPYGLLPCTSAAMFQQSARHPPDHPRQHPTVCLCPPSFV